MRYPRLCNWVRIRKITDRKYVISNLLFKEEYAVDSIMAEFAGQLDGYKDPLLINTTLSVQDVRNMLRYLRKRDVIRTSRITFCGAGTFLYSIWNPKNIKSKNVITLILSWLLLLLWLPALILGVYMFSRYSFYISRDISFPGLLAGLISGVILHELGHGVTALSCGAYVFEFGLSINYYFYPGAYTLMDFDHCHIMQRIKILLAGVETNFLLTGLYFTIAAFNQYESSFWFTAAVINGGMGLLNLLFADGLDGTRVFIELIGGDPTSFLDNSKAVVKNSAKRRLLRQKGFSGYAIIILSYMTLIAQIVYPVLLIINILAIFGGLS